MNGVQILKEIRRRLNDVESVVSGLDFDHSDEYLFQFIASASNIIDVYSVGDSEYIVDEDALTISPEPSKIDGLLLATWAVSHFLDADISQKLRDGELGVSFVTGHDSISTIEAARRVKDISQKSRDEYESLVCQKLANKISGSERVQ